MEREKSRSIFLSELYHDDTRAFPSYFYTRFHSSAGIHVGNLLWIIAPSLDDPNPLGPSRRFALYHMPLERSVHTATLI